MKRLLLPSLCIVAFSWAIGAPQHVGELLRAHRQPESKHRSGLTNIDLEIPQLITVRRAYILKNIPEGRVPVRCWQMTASDATNTVYFVTNQPNLMLIELQTEK